MLPVIHYRILFEGVMQDYYWSATHTPLRDATGEVTYVLQHTVNVTALQRSGGPSCRSARACSGAPS